MTHKRSTKKIVRRTKPPQRIPLQSPSQEQLVYKRIQENLNRMESVVEGLLEHSKRLRISNQPLQEQVAVAVKEALGKRMQRMQLGERSLEVLEEMQRIVLELRNSTQIESLNQNHITREYIR